MNDTVRLMSGSVGMVYRCAQKITPPGPCGESDGEELNECYAPTAVYVNSSNKNLPCRMRQDRLNRAAQHPRCPPRSMQQRGRNIGLSGRRGRTSRERMADLPMIPNRQKNHSPRRILCRWASAIGAVRAGDHHGFHCSVLPPDNATLLQARPTPTCSPGIIRARFPTRGKRPINFLILSVVMTASLFLSCGRSWPNGAIPIPGKSR